MAEVRIILTDQEDGRVGIHLECDEEMSLLNRHSDTWTAAQNAAAEVYYRLVNGEVLLPAGDSGE